MFTTVSGIVSSKIFTINAAINAHIGEEIKSFFRINPVFAFPPSDFTTNA